jgi:chemotaxis protein histidine kinase CheA
VTPRQEALLARYRAISRERLRTIRKKLEDVALGNAEALAEVRRELHTLKGDSHLMGMVTIGQVAHACEQRLTDPRGLADAAAAITAALDAIKAALLDEATDRTVSDGILQQALTELTAAPPQLDPPQPGQPQPDPPQPDQPQPDQPDKPDQPQPDQPQPDQPRPDQPQPDQPQPDQPQPQPQPDQPQPRKPKPPEPELAAQNRYIPVTVNARDVDVVCERLSALHADLGRIHAALRGQVAVARDTMHDVERLRADLDEIVSSAWALRLQPVHPALADLADGATKLAREQHKQLEVRIDDGGARAERRLLDEVRDPLIQLIRNAVDHGIEVPAERGGKPVPALIVLAAEGRGDEVVITVTDDGRGIDYAAVRATAIAKGLLDAKASLTKEAARELLFAHRFSTKPEKTKISGEGVGLDVVRRTITAIGGRVSCSDNPGGGTRFAINIPSTVFRERVLIADVGGALCALPARQVEAVIPIASTMMERVGSASLLRYGGEGLPFLPLPLFRGAADSTRAAIVSHAGQRWAISLPDLVGDVELLRVPVDAAVASLGPFAASGTLDDGRLVLVVSLDALLARPRQITDLIGKPIGDRSRRRVMVVDDSPIVRDLLTELLASVGLEVRSAGDGADALAQLADHPVDLIVCDVEMPVMDGFELLRKLRDRERERGERIPVVMVTTRGSVADRSLAASLGADALIVKSEFENAHLLDTVRRFVEIRA